jgi:hypothetical protein
MMRPPTTSKEKAMRGVSLLLPLGLSLACAAGIAVAQPAGPDMTGTWTGTNRSIVSGLPAHFPVTAPSVIVDGNRLVELKVTVRIDGQDEGRFWGTLSSESKAEPIIGVIGADGKRVRMIGQGGSAIDGTLLDDGTLELFYTENRAGVSVAATNVLKKAK